VRNLLFITLSSALNRLLNTPADRFEDPSDMVTMIRDTKDLLNQAADAVLGPDLADKAVVFGAFGKQFGQLCTLLVAQSRRCPRCRLAFESVLALFSRAFHPLADSTFAHTQGLGNRFLAPALLLEFVGAQSTSFAPIGWFISSSHLLFLQVYTWSSILYFSNLCRNQYFTHHETSGFVEGFNNKLKVLKRRCYGLRNVGRLFQRLTLDLDGYRRFSPWQARTH